MTKAKKIIALILAAVTIFSITTVMVNAEDTTGATNETTTSTPTTETTTPSTTLDAINIVGGTQKVSGDKITITADAKATEVKVYKNDTVSFDAQAPFTVDNGVLVVTYDAWHKDAESKVVNKAECTITVDGKVYAASVVFTGEDAEAHRYEKSLGKTDATYEAEGYELFECTCGAQARKNKVAKLPGKVVKVNCGPDLGIAKDASGKIVANVEMLGEAKYTVTYATSDDKVVTVNEKGEIKGVAIGRATITCTVKDAQGTTVTDTVDVKVSYSLVQWILVAAEAYFSGVVFIFDLILDALGLMK